MMRGRMVRAFFFIAILSLFAADISVGCGQGYVYGPVTQKFSPSGGEYMIAISNSPYEVPIAFYYQVRVGDTVKFDGREWTIVQRPGAPAPASPPP